MIAATEVVLVVSRGVLYQDPIATSALKFCELICCWRCGSPGDSHPNRYVPASTEDVGVRYWSSEWKQSQTWSWQKVQCHSRKPGLSCAAVFPVFQNFSGSLPLTLEWAVCLYSLQLSLLLSSESTSTMAIVSIDSIYCLWTICHASIQSSGCQSEFLSN